MTLFRFFLVGLNGAAGRITSSMSKRKVTFEDGDGEITLEDAPKKKIVDGVSGPGSRFKEKHSLDSDEEDEGEVGENSSKYDILANDDVEGV
ncbi:CD2 antigen cytoplasmic tail-binding protein 2-like [Sinocyclocheilus anshuiensis]|uniref:CD2 antigen cytoplasmic tail-binding protein 2-like n=1 Tax=Sinocyclocheilus anshuiensis TaxID=1608454 RepID=UPI0007B8FDFA|nr:PREDICTED: CD2 antigen cytoplasmic tail-binding protein 2-like [Sinocyclocheilus anshuiensis]